MSRPQPYDALTGLTLFVQGSPDEIFAVSWGAPSSHRPRRYCRRHMVQREYNDMTKGNAKRQPMTMFDEIIAEDRISDALRRGKFALWPQAQRAEWLHCRHCFNEQRSRV